MGEQAYLFSSVWCYWVGVMCYVYKRFAFFTIFGGVVMVWPSQSTLDVTCLSHDQLIAFYGHCTYIL